MPSIYSTVFGGNPVAPAIPTYLPLSFAVNTTLGWPLESNITSPAVAAWIDGTATVGGLALQFSDARQVSTGYATIFNNVGANTFSVLDAQGNTLASIASGQAWVFVLADNSTLQGTWRIVQFGAGVSSANAAALAGAGLKAITTTLNERIVINPQAVNYTALAADRASCLDWTGGSGGTFTIDPVGLGSDWFCYIKNSGTGVLTVSPASGTIDGSASKTFNPNDSCIVLSNGTNLITMGFGQSVASSFNFVTISLAGASGTVILTGAQLNRISYKFTGALAGNTTVQTPASIQQYWMDNETTGAFTLTFSSGGGGSTYTLPQAQRTILYCDGLNIVQAITSGSIQFGDGTAAAPSITFASDLTLGFYKAGTDVLGISTAGVQRATINASGQMTLNAPSSGTALTVNGLAGAGVAGLQQASGNDVTLSWIQTSIATWNITNKATSGTLAFNNGADRLTVNTSGNVTVNAPASGVAVSATGALAANIALFTSGNSATTGTADIQINRAGSTANSVAQGPSIELEDTTNVTATALQNSGGQTELWQFNASAWNQILKVLSTRGVVINAPASGTALTVTGAVSATGDGSSVSYYVASGDAIRWLGTGDSYIDYGTGGAVSTLHIRRNSTATEVMALGPNGNVTVDAPSAGTALTINGLAGAGVAQVVQASGNDVSVSWVQTSVATWNITNKATSGTLALNNGADRVTLTTAGNVSIAAPTGGVALSVTGLANSYAALVTASTTSGQSFGLRVVGGTTSADVSLAVVNSANTHAYLQVNGDGSGTFGFNGTGNTLSLGAAGNVTISAPATGAALTVNGASTFPTKIVSGSSGTTGANDFEIDRAGSTANSVGQGPNIILNDTTNSTDTMIQMSGGQTELWQFNAGSWHQLAFWNANRALTLNAPASGSTLNVTGIASTAAVNIAGVSTSGVSQGLFVSAGTNSSDYNTTLTNASGASTYFKVRGDGQITLALANDNLGRGVAICKIKNTNTSRTNTTIPAADPELTYAIPSTGTYEVRVVVLCNGAAVGATPGLNIQIAYTGTVGNGMGISSGTMNNISIPPSPFIVNSTNSYSLNTANPQNILVFEGPLQVITTGTVSVSWAQQNSSANATTLSIGSFMLITQLS